MYSNGLGELVFSASYIWSEIVKDCLIRCILCLSSLFCFCWEIGGILMNIVSYTIRVRARVYCWKPAYWRAIDLGSFRNALLKVQTSDESTETFSLIVSGDLSE